MLEPPELVERAMRALSIDPDARGADRELAVRLALNPGDASQGRQTVARWRERGGGHRPSYEATMRLLEAAGLLEASSNVVAIREPDGAMAEPELRELRMQVLEASTAAVERLVELEDSMRRSAERIEQAADRLSPPRRRRATGGGNS